MKTFFKNRLFYWSLLLFLFILLSTNILKVILYNQKTAIIPIVIQVFLLFLILSKNKETKIGLKIWSGIFLIFAPCLKIFGIALGNLAKGIDDMNYKTLLIEFFWLLAGIFIFFMSDKTIDIKHKE